MFCLLIFRLNKTTADFTAAEKDLKLYQNRFSDVQNKYNQASADLKKTLSENKVKARTSRRSLLEIRLSLYPYLIVRFYLPSN